MLIRQRDFMMNHTPLWIAFDCLLQKRKGRKKEKEDI